MLANLSATGTASTQPGLWPGIDLAGDAGRVRSEASALTGGPNDSSLGLRAHSSADVAIAGCELRGGPSTSVVYPGTADGPAAT